MFYGFDMDRMLKGLLADLLFGNIGLEIPTYVRNDNSTAAYQVDSANTVTNAKHLNGLPESNRGIREKQLAECWLYSWGFGYIRWTNKSYV